MESRLRLILVFGGLPRPVSQFVVRDRTGMFVARVDLVYPEQRLAIEYEGDHHRGRGVINKISAGRTPCGRVGGPCCASARCTFTAIRAEW
jgi:hypothetical protein